ncbi:uncharacterized protein C8Q71DRAFT_64997 [Rhodofomes roseus]|uniref:ABC transmembrane type-1 domain-containing protein n=1 Tax=Rhodofomes roseus TaxID=34475 RepID=A0ABQ8KF00_9APHY|nr:uncharacterized protein C8Q71DRAFT_64997 [Rhodofomes roseus]KAH9836078.1 hypothetical protein C8Q71DRAFT_64997 [Rhodofomes roseus]
MLTYWRTSNIHRALRMQGRKRNLASMVLKDGTVYFAQLTFLNIMSAIGVKLRDGIVVQFAQVLASIVFSRFILDLRNFYLTDSGGDTGYAPSDAALQGSGTFSTVVFSHWRVVGNFGATVEDWLGDSHEEHLNTSSVQNVPQFSEDPFSAGLLQAMEVPEGQVTPPIIA